MRETILLSLLSFNFLQRSLNKDLDSKSKRFSHNLRFREDKSNDGSDDTDESEEDDSRSSYSRMSLRTRRKKKY